MMATGSLEEKDLGAGIKGPGTCSTQPGWVASAPGPGEAEV